MKEARLTAINDKIPANSTSSGRILSTITATSLQQMKQAEIAELEAQIKQAPPQERAALHESLANARNAWSVLKEAAELQMKQEEIDELSAQIKGARGQEQETLLKRLAKAQFDLTVLREAADDVVDAEQVVGRTEGRIGRAFLEVGSVVFFAYIGVDMIAAAEGHKWISGSIEPFRAHLANDLTSDMNLGKGVKYGHLYGVLMILAVIAAARWVYRKEKEVWEAIFSGQEDEETSDKEETSAKVSNNNNQDPQAIPGDDDAVGDSEYSRSEITPESEELGFDKVDSFFGRSN